MKPVTSALIFAIILVLTNVVIDQMTGAEARPLSSLLIGAAVGGIIFGLVIHLWGRRQPSA